MTQGWIKLHRQICENELWLAESFTKGQAWVDLLLNANHEEKSFWVRGIEVRVKRGQIAWSELTMASRWLWSKNKVRRFLNMLETKQQIEQQKTFITSVISIKNYSTYQETEQQAKQQKDSKRYTTKELKNDKNVKKEENTNTNEFGVEEFSKEIWEVFGSFKEVNRMWRHWGIKPQYAAAAQRMIVTYGLIEVKKTASLLHLTNGQRFMPNITNPVKLEEKWEDLCSLLERREKETEGERVAVIDLSKLK